LRAAFGLAPAAGTDPFLISLALLGVLAELAEERPLVCLVDDAQWLDDSSASALLFAARRIEAEGVAVVFALREGEERRLRGPRRRGGPRAAGVVGRRDRDLRVRSADRGNRGKRAGAPRAAGDADAGAAEWPRGAREAAADRNGSRGRVPVAPAPAARADAGP